VTLQCKDEMVVVVLTGICRFARCRSELCCFRGERSLRVVRSRYNPMILAIRNSLRLHQWFMAGSGGSLAAHRPGQTDYARRRLGGQILSVLTGYDAGSTWLLPSWLVHFRNGCLWALVTGSGGTGLIGKSRQKN